MGSGTRDWRQRPLVERDGAVVAVARAVVVVATTVVGTVVGAIELLGAVLPPLVEQDTTRLAPTAATITLPRHTAGCEMCRFNR